MITVSDDHTPIGTVRRVAFDDEARVALRHASARVHDAGLAHQDYGALVEAKVASLGLPASLHRIAAETQMLDTVVAVVLEGVIQAASLNLGPTPPHWRQADGSDSAHTAWAGLILGSFFGSPIAWQSQQAGRLVTDVLPSRGMETSKVSSSSSTPLTWHTEDAFHEGRADWVGLLCLRNPSLVATTLGALPSRSHHQPFVSILAEERFVLIPDDAHEGPRAAVPPTALLRKTGDGLDLRVDRDFTAVANPDDAEARTALDWFVDELDRSLIRVVLSPGDMGFINNRRVVHGRDAFEAEFTGEDRWLKRINLVRDIVRTRPFRPAATSLVLT